jgi:hypothetical protein
MARGKTRPRRRPPVRSTASSEGRADDFAFWGAAYTINAWHCASWNYILRSSCAYGIRSPRDHASLNVRSSPSCRGLGPARANPSRVFGRNGPRALRETQCVGLACRSFLGRSPPPPCSPAVRFRLRSLAACVSLSIPAPLATWVRWQSRRFPRTAC